MDVQPVVANLDLWGSQQYVLPPKWTTSTVKLDQNYWYTIDAKAKTIEKQPYLTKRKVNDQGVSIRSKEVFLPFDTNSFFLLNIPVTSNCHYESHNMQIHTAHKTAEIEYVMLKK